MVVIISYSIGSRQPEIFSILGVNGCGFTPFSPLIDLLTKYDTVILLESLGTLKSKIPVEIFPYDVCLTLILPLGLYVFDI